MQQTGQKVRSVEKTCAETRHLLLLVAIAGSFKSVPPSPKRLVSGDLMKRRSCDACIDILNHAEFFERQRRQKMRERLVIETILRGENKSKFRKILLFLRN